MQPFHIPLPGYALNSVCHGDVLLPALPALTKLALLPALPALETSLACTHKAALPRTHKGPGEVLLRLALPALTKPAVQG